MPLVEGGNWDLILSNLLLPSLLWNFFNVVNKLCKLYYSIYIFCYFQMKSSVKRLIQKTIVLHRLTSREYQGSSTYKVFSEPVIIILFRTRLQTFLTLFSTLAHNQPNSSSFFLERQHFEHYCYLSRNKTKSHKVHKPFCLDIWFNFVHA